MQNFPTSRRKNPLPGLLAAAALLSLALLTGCTSGRMPETAPLPAAVTPGPVLEQEFPVPERLSIRQAEALVLAWHRQAAPDLNPSVEIQLEEITTPAIWEAFSAQVFKVSGMHFLFETYLVRQGKVQPLGTAFGGMGVSSLLVKDADGDGLPELLYTYSWGSGISRAQLGLYSPALTEPLAWDYSLFQAELFLKDDPALATNLWSALPDGRQLPLGLVTLEQSRIGPVLEVNGIFPAELSELLVKTPPLPEDAPDRLDLQSTSGQILALLQNPRWQTLWVIGQSETDVFEEGTAILFWQGWLDRSGEGRIISSDQYSDSSPLPSEISARWAWTSKGGAPLQLDLLNYPRLPAFELSRWDRQRLPLQAAAQAVSRLPFWGLEGVESAYFEPVSLEEAAGRAALRVSYYYEPQDAKPQSELWVDVQTGLVLRMQSYGTAGSVVNDRFIEQVEYNLEIPAWILDWQYLALARFEPGPQSVPPAGMEQGLIVEPEPDEQAYTASVLIEDFTGAAPEEIARALFEQYLNYFKTSPLSARQRLDDYEIHSISSSQGYFNATYSLKPALLMYSNAVAGNGVITADKWVRNKVLNIAVEQVGGEYQLSLVGNG